MFVHAYKTVAYANKMVDHIIFIKKHLRPVKKKVGKH